MRPGSGDELRGAEAERAPAHVDDSRVDDEREQLRQRREVRGRGREVAVRGPVGDEAADERHDVAEPRRRAPARTSGLAGSATSSSATRPPGRNTRAHSGEDRRERGEVAERESARDPVERRVGERQAQRVGAHERRVGVRRRAACRPRSRRRPVCGRRPRACGRGRRYRTRGRALATRGGAPAPRPRFGARRRPCGT